MSDSILRATSFDMAAEYGAGDVNRHSVEVRCFPTSDADFRDHIEGLLATWDGEDLTPDALVDRLVTTYPKIRVEPQSSLGALGPGDVLYLYRDGHA